MEVSLIDYCGSDLSVVNAARVSFDKESKWEETIPLDYLGEISAYKLSDKDSKLIRYLAKHKHFSPFNHAFITVRVKAPIFVARQLVKHEYMPWNEVSRRYVDSDPEFYIPTSFRSKADNVKQGSGGNIEGSVAWKEGFTAASHQSLRLYQYAIINGMCPEQARMILPQNTMTEWYWSGTLGAFAKMLGLRLDSHTQVETREVAIMVRDIIEPLFPVSLDALLSYYKE